MILKSISFWRRIRNNSNAIVGGWALRAIKEIRADVAVLGTSGFMDKKGPCVENFEEEEIKQSKSGMELHTNKISKS